MKDFFTLDDFDFNGKFVGIRIDLNSHLENGKVQENVRFKVYSKSVRELLEKNAKVIVLAHQGRKGKEDFICLERHSKIFEKYVGKEVKFVNDIVGEKAKKEIQNLENGDILLLDNVRFLEDETSKKSIEEYSNSSLVKFLSNFIDYYVLDAFSVAHRMHASIVGFALVKPMIAGRVFIEEIESTKKVMESLGLNTWIMGGAKIDDCIEVIDYVLNNKPESMEKVLTGGMLANLFLLAKGYEIGNKSKELLERKGYLALLPKAKELLEKFDKEIVLPIDVAIEFVGKRIETEVYKIPDNGFVLDIGEKTIEHYSEIIKESRNVIFKGPLGMYEKTGFEIGTKRIFEEILKSNVYSLIGGGDTSLALERLGFKREQFSHVSIGGGALIKFLSGKELPGIKALKLSFQKFKNLLV
ncbi:MAG: phosphoglycerate kinase [Candidatus Aenigmarchaeota archaeon ex4484_224]|nr:MAG: phosphoglycerate kinase [Candidatus Aenigmarchaeota archaeon ex4484_224]